MRRFFLVLILALAVSRACGPVRAQDGGISNQVSCSYSDGSGKVLLGGLSTHSQLVDPRGTVTGCDGTPLPSYRGFQVGLYTPDPSDPTGTEIKDLVPLTPTAVPAAAGLPLGTLPNAGNLNPFPLSDADRGRFSMLLDASRGQINPGRVYILVLAPPPGSTYRTRRIRITFGPHDGSQVSYTATSLDGAPISGMTGLMSATSSLLLTSAGSIPLTAMNMTLTDCPLREVQITKTGDRATAEPGDTVVYRITVTNTTTLPMAAIQVLDTLPVGFDLRPDSPRAAVGTTTVPVTLGQSGAATVFNFGALTLTPGQTLSLAYALLLTPDALRGDGINSAVVTASALMTMNGTLMTSPVSDGPATFALGVRQGILTDTGTILGRVWVDRSRDGEQQDGEPGLPGAVVLLDDATRIVADANGLFSLAAVPAGYHSAVLDMQSVPGYVLARSRFKERRSQSRMVHLTPGGMARLNFAVVPSVPPAPNNGGAGEDTGKESAASPSGQSARSGVNSAPTGSFPAPTPPLLGAGGSVPIKPAAAQGGAR